MSARLPVLYRREHGSTTTVDHLVVETLSFTARPASQSEAEAPTRVKHVQQREDSVGAQVGRMAEAEHPRVFLLVDVGLS